MSLALCFSPVEARTLGEALASPALPWLKSLQFNEAARERFARVAADTAALGLGLLVGEAAADALVTLLVAFANARECDGFDATPARALAASIAADLDAHAEAVRS